MRSIQHSGLHVARLNITCFHRVQSDLLTHSTPERGTHHPHDTDTQMVDTAAPRSRRVHRNHAGAGIHKKFHRKAVSEQPA